MTPGEDRSREQVVNGSALPASIVEDRLSVTVVRGLIGRQRVALGASQPLRMKSLQQIVITRRFVHLRKIAVPTHQSFQQMAAALPLAGGYRLETQACVERSIDDRRRLLPNVKEAFGERMKTEYVLVFHKKRC